MLDSIASSAKRHGIFPLKYLGQNFIYDTSLCRKIARSANITPSDIVLEIGPGTAGLTRAILESSPERLITIERDTRCISLLNEVKNYYHNLEIIEGDALDFSLSSIIERFHIPRNQKLKIVANLPYHIATHLITKWLYDRDKIELMILMVQKEVAERIASIDSCKSYGRLSVFCQVLSQCKVLFDVSRESFYPPPKVTSSIIKIEPSNKVNITDQELSFLESLTQQAFSMRRKQLRTGIKSILHGHQINPEILTLRPENLTPFDYFALVKKLMAQIHD